MRNVTVVIFNSFIRELRTVFFVPFLDAALLVDMKWFELVKFSLHFVHQVLVNIEMIGCFHIVVEELPNQRLVKGIPNRDGSMLW